MSIKCAWIQKSWMAWWILLVKNSHSSSSTESPCTMLPWRNLEKSELNSLEKTHIIGSWDMKCPLWKSTLFGDSLYSKSVGNGTSFTHTNSFSILQIHRTYNNVILHRHYIIYMFGKLEQRIRKRVSQSIYYLSAILQDIF